MFCGPNAIHLQSLRDGKDTKDALEFVFFNMGKGLCVEGSWGLMGPQAIFIGAIFLSVSDIRE